MLVLTIVLIYNINVNGLVAEWFMHLPLKQGHLGSNPSKPSILADSSSG